MRKDDRKINLKFLDEDHCVLLFENKSIIINEDGIFISGEKIHDWKQKETEIIHLIETNKVPIRGTIVHSNCGKTLVFKEAISAEFDDRRFCDKCYEVHMKNLKNKANIAFVEIVKTME